MNNRSIGNDQNQIISILTMFSLGHSSPAISGGKIFLITESTERGNVYSALKIYVSSLPTIATCRALGIFGFIKSNDAIASFARLYINFYFVNKHTRNKI